MSTLESTSHSYGLTQRGVYETIIEFLNKNEISRITKILDIPCGQGEFLKKVQDQFPTIKLTGADITSPKQSFFEFNKIDARKKFELEANIKFDLITCISGVPEFDNTSGFIANCLTHLKPGGMLIVTNDNSFTVRDRITYLLFGKLRRYNLLIETNEATYHHCPIQELYKIFNEQQLKLLKVKYLGIRMEDLLFLPLACLLFITQKFYLLKTSGKFSTRIDKTLFPFGSLIYRHYVLFAQKPDNKGEN